MKEDTLRTLALVGGYISLIVGIFLAFGKEWGSLILLLISSVSFYHGRDGLMGSISLGLFLIIILRMVSYILLPIGLALVIAFVFLPVVSFLERYKIPRWLSSLVIILGMFIFISTAGFLLVYNVYNQGYQLLKTVEAYYMNPQEFEVFIRSHVKNEELINLLVSAYSQTFKGIYEYDILNYFPALRNLLTSSIEIVFSTLLGLVMGFYALKDTKVIASEIEGLLPERFKPIMEESYSILSQYFRGQLTVATIVGVFVGLSLQVLGIKYGLLIGFIAGLMNLIPNVGFAMTVLLGSIILLISEPGIVPFLKFAIVLILDQLLETLVLTPRILGKSVGLHPVLVIIALIAGASLFGALGVILAVPGAALLRSLWINKIKGKI